MQNHQHEPHDEALERALSRLYKTEEPSAGFESAWRAAVRREEKIQLSTQGRKSHRFWRIAAPAFASLVLVAGSLWTGTQSLTTPASEERGSAQVAYESEQGSPSLAKSNASLNGGMEQASYAVADQAEAGGGTGGVLSARMADQKEVAQGERKLVRSASLTIRSIAFETDVEKVRGLVDELGGYVEDLYQYGDQQNGSTRVISLSTRVPSDKLDLFLGGMEGIGRVTDRSESTSDLTVQYVDNEARLNTLHEKMKRLNELLQKAETVSDLVEIENAIADTQYQIDSYETSQRGIDRRVDMSAVSVTVMEETPAESAASGNVSLGERLSAGLNASVKWLGEFFRNMLVFIVMALPVLVPVAVIGLVVWLCVRRRKRRGGKTGGSLPQ